MPPQGASNATGSTATGNRRSTARSTRSRVTQIRMHPPAREYMARRASEGKTNREALRALKRHLIRTIYRVLLAAPTRN